MAGRQKRRMRQDLDEDDVDEQPSQNDLLETSLAGVRADEEEMKRKCNVSTMQLPIHIQI